MKTTSLVENTLESFTAEDKSNVETTELLEQIDYLINHPINLNTATAKELQQVYLFSDYQIKSLLKYREVNGAIYSIYELQLVSGFSTSFIQNITPLISISPVALDIEKQYSRHLLLLKTEMNVQKERAYSTNKKQSRYLGNPFKYYARYHYIHREKIQMGFTAEKDKGEPFFVSPNKNGFDYYSAFIQLDMDHIIQQINVGDYQIKFGQGLSLWSGMRRGKSSFTTQNQRKYQGVYPYKSTNENLFFRGVAATLSPIKNSELVLFASDKKIDATIDTNNYSITALVATGLHRSLKELDKKHNAKEQAIGGYFAFNTESVKTGISFVYYRFSLPLTHRKKAYYAHHFTGASNYDISFCYKTNINDFVFWGEIARSKSGGIGVLQGVDLQLHSQVRIEAIYRNYAKNYHARYAAAFAERSETRNESGFYLGITIYPFSKWSVKTYYDQYQFSWLTYRAASPIAGHDYFAEISFAPNSNFCVYLRYHQENKPENIESILCERVAEVQKNQYRLHFTINPAVNWQLRNRIEFLYYQKNQQKQTGFLVYQDIIYQSSEIPLRIGVRYAVFDTDSYLSKIYAYENDVLYNYSIPAYYDKGIRFYINVKYQIHQKVTLYFRYAQTHYTHKKTQGRGMSTIKGNNQSDLKLLALIKL